jgi:phosphoglycolate phosphatase
MKNVDRKKDKIILFDLDGTLIDSTDAIIESFSVAFGVFGAKAPDDAIVKAQIGYPLDIMFVSMGVSESEVDGYVQAYKKHYREISCAKTVLLPMGREAVELASGHAILGVVTTKTAKYSIELLEHMGLMAYFDVLIGREDVVEPKPHPEPIQKAIQQLPKVTGSIWMIGDTCMDMESAHRAGIDKMAVLCGYGSKKLLSSCTEKIAANAYEAVEDIIAYG